MKQGKYAAPVKRRRRRRNPLKPVLIAMAVVLLLGCAAGSTLAWLTSSTAPVTNTFTVGKVEIDLTEPQWTDLHANGAKMVPGCTITKDPKVTVKAGSEPCYLFVKITESTDPKLSDYIAYEVSEYSTDNPDGWRKLTGAENVWYKEIPTATAVDTYHSILAAGSLESGYSWSENQVLVKPTVTKADMDALDAPNAAKPTLSFQAAAVQFYKSNGVKFDPVDALKEITWAART